MRTPRMLDPLAERLLDLRRISATQWALRGLGVVGLAVATVLAMPGGPLANLGTGVVTLVVAVGAFALVLRPDSEVGALAPIAVLAVLVPQPQLSMGRAALVGVALLVAHGLFALAATIPSHGTLERSAWRLWAWTLLVVIGISAAAGLLLAMVSLVELGPWTISIAVLAVLGLVVLLLPKRR